MYNRGMECKKGRDCPSDNWDGLPGKRKKDLPAFWQAAQPPDRNRAGLCLPMAQKPRRRLQRHGLRHSLSSDVEKASPVHHGCVQVGMPPCKAAITKGNVTTERADKTGKKQICKWSASAGIPGKHAQPFYLSQ